MRSLAAGQDQIQVGKGSQPPLTRSTHCLARRACVGWLSGDVHCHDVALRVVVRMWTANKRRPAGQEKQASGHISRRGVQRMIEVDDRSDSISLAHKPKLQPGRSPRIHPLSTLHHGCSETGLDTFACPPRNASAPVDSGPPFFAFSQNKQSLCRTRQMRSISISDELVCECCVPRPHSAPFSSPR